MHLARTAPWPLPAEPEHRGSQRIKPGRVWPWRLATQRDAGPILRWAGPMPQGKEKPPLCKGGTAWQGHAGGIVKPGK